MVFLFGFEFDIIFVAFPVEVLSNWPVESFLFPLLNVLEVVFQVEGGVSNESVFVLENDLFIVIDVGSFKAEILDWVLVGSLFGKVGVNALDSSFVGSVEVTDGVPHLSLDFEVVLEIFYYLVVLLYLCFFMVFIKFGVNVFR